MIGFFALALLLPPSPSSRAATLATIRTSVGALELELYDQDKPVTVSNFIAYVQSGRFKDTFIQRWETNFVIQAGGYYVATNASGIPTFRTVPIFGEITNEYRSGTIHSNLYGTIAMARRSGATNSATSQWFINVADNLFLDGVDGGFTVFGQVPAGTNILNRFIPPVGTSGIYRASVSPFINEYNEIISGLTTLPVLNAVDPTYDDLIYLDFSLRRDLGLTIKPGLIGKTISWNSVAGYSNIVEYATGVPYQWQTLTNLPGTGSVATIADDSADSNRTYRVKLLY